MRHKPAEGGASSPSSLVEERGRHKKIPLSDRSNPVSLLERWEHDGLIKMTPGLRHRILSEYKDVAEELPAELEYDLTELVKPANGTVFKPLLPERCVELRLARVTEILKGIVGADGEEGDYLLSTTVLFPFGEHDIIALMRRESSLFLDAKAIDRGDWPVGTLIVTFTSA
jgi:hypothetical protein